MAATDIVLVSDFYFHRWKKGAGELWLCVRPHVKAPKSQPRELGNLDAFLAWAAGNDMSSSGGTDRFRYLDATDAGAAGGRCGLNLLPVSLPSDVDLEVVITRRSQVQDGPSEEVRIPIRRTQGPKVAAVQLGQKRARPDEALPPITGSTEVFQAQFNRLVKAQFDRATADVQAGKPDVRPQLAFSFAERLEAGRRIAFNAGNVDPLPNDYLDVTDKHTPSGSQESGLYWFLGLMARIGTVDHLADIQRIERVDVRLLVQGSQVFVLQIPRLSKAVGIDAPQTYFGKITDDFQRTLTPYLPSREPHHYLAPGITALREAQAAEPAGVWSAGGPGGQQAGAAEGEPDAFATLTATDLTDRLKSLIAIELRPQTKDKDTTAPPVTGQVTFQPGLLVRGQLRPYRRFPTLPAASGGQSRLPTVLTFEPDADTAPLLAAFLAAAGRSAGDLLERAFAAAVDQDWSYGLLHAGVLPWDGPDPRYKVLADPKGSRKAAEQEPRTHKGGAFALFLPATDKALDATRHGVRHLLQTGAKSVPALAAYWAGINGGSRPEQPINAVRVTPVDAAQQTVKLSFAHDFSFRPAESTVSLERVLTYEVADTRPPEDCQDGTPPPMDPEKDFREDFINFNAVRMFDRQTGRLLEPDAARRPRRVGAGDTGTQSALRKQSVPLLRRWPHDPRDVEGADLPAVMWQEVRDHVARQYGLRTDASAGPFDLELEHTYGEAYIPKSGGASLSVERSRKIDSDVWLPTYAETTSADGSRQTFLTCEYAITTAGPIRGPRIPRRVGARKQMVTLRFALDALQGQVAAGGTGKAAQPYLLALSAWRSLGELAAADATCAIEAEVATYDLTHVIEPTAANAGEPLARNGFPGDWTKAVRTRRTYSYDEGAVPELAKIRAWAKDLLRGGALQADPFELTLPGDILGDQGHLLQLLFHVNRGDKLAPPAASIAVPISQQPGLFYTPPNTVQAAWEALGYGPDDPRISEPTDPKTPLEVSFADFLARRRAGSDGITVKPPAPLPDNAPDDEKLEAERKAKLAGALIASLPGSDWFAPPGEGPLLAAGLQLEPVLLPLGFAPCAPDGPLKTAAQLAAQRMAAALGDAIDLAYEDWALNSNAAKWRDRFGQIVDLGADQEADGRGRLRGFARQVREALMFPQPDGGRPETAATVRTLVDDVRRLRGDFAYFPAAIERKLMQQPSVFTDSKALLLTVMRFSAASPARTTPAPERLARARFHRRLATLGADGKPRTEDVVATTSLEHLVLASATPRTPGSDLKDGLAFLETLDDTLYPNSFEIPPAQAPKPRAAAEPADYVAESYEQLVDLLGPRETAWAQAPAIVPLAAYDSDPKLSRRVDLASRSIVEPPVMFWSGGSAEISRRLAQHLKDWDLDRLKDGYVSTQSGVVQLTASAVYEDVPPLSGDQAEAYALYRIAGDEEQVSVLEAFKNDGAFIRIGAYEGPGVAQRADAADDFAAAEPYLRMLLTEPRGSAKAAEAISSLALKIDPQKPEAFKAMLGELLRPTHASLPGKDTLLLRRRPARPDEIPPLPHKGQTLEKGLVRHVLFLEPATATAGEAQVAYLLIGYRTDVWSRRQLEIVQGRNLPFGEWGSDDPAAPEPRFAEEFWQAAPQAGKTVSPDVLRSEANEPAHWTTRRVRLDSAYWLGQARTPAELVNVLLKAGKVHVGDWTTDDPLISANAPWSGPYHSITTYQELLAEDPAKGVHGRVQLPEGSYQSSDLSIQERVWFPSAYRTFSVDFRWLNPSGDPFLEFMRIYVDFS